MTPAYICVAGQSQTWYVSQELQHPVQKDIYSVGKNPMPIKSEWRKSNTRLLIYRKTCRLKEGA